MGAQCLEHFERFKHDRGRKASREKLRMSSSLQMAPGRATGRPTRCDTISIGLTGVT
jgi:hypothetical protein